MAETKEKKVDLDELVPFEAFKDNDKYKDDITVIVNGKIWRIQRGVEVMIPRYVYNVIKQSEKQDLAATNFAEAKQQAYKKSSKNFE
jgi:hypothetical protein